MQVRGSIAQLGEHLPYKQGVIGSSPIVPTTYLREWLSGRASPCQGERREFESRFPLHYRRYSQAVRPRSAKPLCPGSNPSSAAKKFDKFRLVEFFYPSRRLGISSRRSRVYHQGRIAPLYLITRQRVSSCDLMIYNTLC